jgi:hypothetical protein
MNIAEHKKPNFFIIGAPKCGTTSLANWLSAHPEVYIPPVKEPHFFNTDMNYINTSNTRQYQRLFKGVRDHHAAAGEASVFYLYSNNAVFNIEQYQPHARYLVLLRNPVDMAYSLHEQMVVAANENVEDFWEAWQLANQRARGYRIPNGCRDHRIINYYEICRLGHQVEKLHETILPNRILFLLLDDLKSDPRSAYLRVLSFLNVRDDGRATFPTRNPAKQRRSMLARRIVKGANDVRRRSGVPRLGTGLMSVADKWNTVYRPRSSMEHEVRSELQKVFAPEIERLEAQIGRNISEWKSDN